MILALVYIACLLTVPLARGRLAALADIQLAKPGLAGAAIFIQIVIITIIPGSVGALGDLFHMLSYALLGAFAWCNRRVAGVPIIAAGGIANFIAETAYDVVAGEGRDHVVTGRAVEGVRAVVTDDRRGLWGPEATAAADGSAGD